MPTASWTCPFCNRDTTVTPSDCHQERVVLSIDNKHGKRIALVRFIVCPNSKCKEFSLDLSLYEWRSVVSVGWVEGDLIRKWNLIPPSNAKSFPDYIPKPILEDYEEACLIKNQSPKASATLARRCLQGMIRNFMGVKERRLFDAIEAIKDKVEKKTWEAIDAVREIGNIGAHMQEDINLIIDVEPSEAGQLIKLIEILMEDWYIDKHEREKTLEDLKKLGAQKKGEKESSKKEGG